MSTVKINEYDSAEFLDNEEIIAEYLAVAMEDPDPDVFIAALATVARARGMTRLDKDRLAGAIGSTLAIAEYRGKYGK